MIKRNPKQLIANNKANKKIKTSKTINEKLKRTPTRLTLKLLRQFRETLH